MMQRIDDPANGFPWERVKAAKRYLYAVKPWWSRFGEKMVIVPTYVQPDEGKKYGSITSTDQSFRIYIDRTFATSAPLHYLAGSIEHEFQHHTRNTWKRLQWLNPDDWHEYANIALDLEINSGIDAEQKQLDVNRIYFDLKNSLIFTQRDFTNWGVTAPPGLDDEGWIPRLISLPDGLAAEEYLKLIQKSQEMYEDEQLSEQSKADEEESYEEEVPDPEPSSGLGDTDGGSDEQEDPDSDAPDDADSDGDGDSGDKEDGDQDSESDDSEGSENDGEGSSDESESTKGEGDQDPEGSDFDDEEDADEPSESMGGGSGNGQATDGQDGEGDAGEKSPDDGKPGEGRIAEQQGAGPSVEIAKAIEEMRSDSHNELWANEIENHADPLSDPQWKPDPEDNADPVSLSEMAAAYAALEEDVSEAISQGAIGFGGEQESQLVKWAATYRKGRGMNWDARFTRLLSAAYTSAKIKGQSDLSYSTRNPNQQPLGVILQGLHSYSPNIYVLQDVSGSMRSNGSMAKSMSAFTDICTKVLANFGEKVTWVAADTNIVDIGQASSWSENLQVKWSYGFGGTDFGDVIMDIFRGKVIHKGKRYPKADLLIISTDCAFEWPRFRPRGNCKILVVNVDDEISAARYIPRWLDKRRELVQIN